ncbi:hypothetical protein DFH08DRAFT_938184 [Mycena albidolilacea]|uniref:Uncharacterized protein n=1 Tax=Mycena albidolilacea TaxID=1033008 RepID=A0AAD7EQC7_9AGAR|nr:hypothetical protein DFH08DRAFT_938184 [Mycena albidolilacea]
MPPDHLPRFVSPPVEIFLLPLWLLYASPKTAKSGQLARRGKNPKRAAFSLAGSLLASALNSNCKTYIQGDIRGAYKVTSPGNMYNKMGDRYGIEACGNVKVGMMVSDNGQRDDGKDSGASK